MSLHKYIINDTLRFTKYIYYEINVLMSYIYDNFPLDYNKMISKNNKLIVGDEYDYGPVDPMGDIDWDESGPVFNCDGNNNVEYYYLFSKNPIKRYIKNVYDPNVELATKTITDELSNFFYVLNKNFDSLKFEYNNIQFMNKSGINRDSRGIRKIDWHISCNLCTKVEKKNGKPITFLQVMDAVYDIKSHKFDNFYEEFNKCTVLDGPKRNGITFVCKFDSIPKET